jgi:hypothetical protein
MDRRGPVILRGGRAATLVTNDIYLDRTDASRLGIAR